MAVRIGTNEAGGTFNMQGRALAALLRDDGLDGIEVVETASASVENARRLGSGTLEFGFMAANWTGRAARGEPPFDRPIAIRMVAPANVGPMFFVVRRESGLRRFDDLRGCRVAVGPEGSGMVQHIHGIFGALGMTLADIRPVYASFAAGAEALAAGEVDAQWQCPVPNRVMTELADRCEVRVLEYGPDQLEAVLAAVPFYGRTILHADAFRGLDRDTYQVGVRNMVVTHERVDAALVGRVAAIMAAQAETLATAEPLYRGLSRLFEALRTEGPAAFEPDGVPLHPGAIAAYRAAGLLI